MPRTVQPEFLDSLPPQHPDAIHNRRDLRLTNRFMGNYRWIERTLVRHLRRAEPVLEIGAGDGELALRLLARGVRVDGLDRWPRPAAWPATLAWHEADLRTFAAYDHYPVVFGNLIFHQFTDAELAALGAELRIRARLIVACEPMRRRLSQVCYRAFGPLLGANRVSLHDAEVSIAGGFLDDELPRALGLASETWEVRCDTTVRGAYHMVAIRRQ